jgi:hypothetical protein
MIRAQVVASLKELAAALGSVAHGTEWHLFGSVDRNEIGASDIDLMILCKSHEQADHLRQSIDLDALYPPIHLSLLTFEEAATINATSLQQSTLVLQQDPGLP